MQGTLNAEPLEEFDAQTICFKLTIIKMTTAPKCVKMSIVKKFVQLKPDCSKNFC